MKKKFVIYEVWTRSYIVEANSAHKALEKAPEQPTEDLTLCNWHAVEIPEAQKDA